ncbi:PDF receptor, partial [Biomphalaria pfeifferi]
SYCRGVWDTVMCWPAAKAGSVIRLPCPTLPGLIKENKAYKICGPNGLWETREKGVFTNDIGYTHYTECYSKEALETYMKYLGNKTLAEKEFIKDIITTSRTLEIVGLCISLITTIISLFIFWYFSTLKCHRTRIHKNLFVAMIVQISMRIILYVDQLVARETGGKIAGAASGDSNTIYDTPIFCEILYSLLEYTKTVKFMWMFVEGIYLHNMIAVSVFSGKPNYVIFYTIGWGFPVLLTVAWVIPMARINTIRCWFGYYMNPLIWIIEGPRAAVMAVNLFFLLNIIRVLVMKLRESETNEADKLRKAVKAAIVLLPLLGLTNFVIMLEPDGHDWVKFSVYSFSTSFLNASEGFFISLLYCFLNGEVQNALRRLVIRHTAYYATDISAAAWRVNTTKVRQACKRQWYRWRQHRLIHSSSLRRMSRSLSIFTSFTEVPHPISSQKSNQTVNGEPSESEVPHSRFSVIFKARHSRRQSSRDLGSVLGPRSMSDVPDLPDIVTCRTDLMCEEKV